MRLAISFLLQHPASSKFVRASLSASFVHFVRRDAISPPDELFVHTVLLINIAINCISNRYAPWQPWHAEATCFYHVLRLHCISLFLCDMHLQPRKTRRAAGSMGARDLGKMGLVGYGLRKHDACYAASQLEAASRRSVTYNSRPNSEERVALFSAVPFVLGVWRQNGGYRAQSMSSFT